MIYKLHPVLIRGFVCLLAAVCASFPSRAAIEHGPSPTNSAATEKHRLDEFYKAEQSLQQQLQVGQRRYNEKQADRAKTIAVMNEELQARQRMVVMPPVDSGPKEPAGPAAVSKSWLALAGLAVLFAGISYFWNRGLPLHLLPLPGRANGKKTNAGASQTKYPLSIAGRPPV